jgi:hypothetical protein
MGQWVNESMGQWSNQFISSFPHFLISSLTLFSAFSAFSAVDICFAYLIGLIAAKTRWMNPSI